MKAFTSLAVLILAINSAMPYPANEVTEHELKVISGNGHFANRLYESLSKTNDGNLVFSPFSAHAALAMLYQGTAGETQKLVGEGLHVSEPETTATGYGQLITKMNSATHVQMSVANKAFVNQDEHIKQSFKDTVVDKFQSEVESVDFSVPKTAVEVINSWVEEKTHDKVKDLLTEGDVSSATELVLVNAVYFKGRWLNEFKKSMTQPGPFYLTETNAIVHEMMHKYAEFLDYKEDSTLGAHIVSLPYADTEYSMVFVVPHERDGITNLNAELLNTDLSAILSGTSRTKVDLTVPKFQIEQKTLLSDQLKEIGLGKIFESDADLSGLLEDSNAKVSEVIQKTFINVDEEGTEAAAATAITLLGSGFDPSEPVKVIADHPFVFLLVKQESHEPNKVNVLFYGRVQNPTETQ